MPQFPFRNPVTGRDGDPPEWSPPDYATPVNDSGGEWKPPEYAKPVEQTKKPSWSSKVKDFLTPADKLDVTKAIPAQFNQFLEEHPAIRNAGRRFLQGPSKEELGGRELAGPGIMKVPGLEKATDYLSEKVTGSGDNYPNIRLAAGVGIKAVGGLLEGAFDPRTVGIKEVPSVRQAKEIPYRFQGDLPSSEPPVRQTSNIQEFIKNNPDAKMKDVEKFVDSIKSSSKSEEKPLPTRSPNLDPNRFKIGEEPVKLGIKSDEDIKYDLARDKFNMGRDLPESKAEFLALNEQGEPMYNIVEKDGTRSTFTGPNELAKRNIEIPETPSDAIPMRGSEIRAKMLADKKKSSFVNPFEKKSVEIVNEWKPPEYAKPVEKSSIIEEIKPKEVTIENAPPNQRAKMFRGAHEPIDILFKDSESREIFGAGQRGFSKGVIKPGLFQRLEQTSNKIAEKFNVSPQEARTAINNYNEEVRRLGSTVDKEGGNITAPSFEEFIKGGKSEIHGGLGGIEPPQPPIEGPHKEVLDKLFRSILDAKERNVSQEIINKSERAKRFAEFSNTSGEGVDWARKAMSKMRGEYDKVEPGAGLGLKPEETNQLFSAVKSARITEPEKLNGVTALFKLLNGEKVPTRSELRILDDVFGNGFSDRIIEMHGGIGAVGLKLSKLANTMKSLQNSISLAAPLRHGIGLVARREFAPAFRDMFKFFGNKEFYDTSMQALESRPTNMLGREAGLFLSRPNSLMGAEEEFLNSYVGHIPLVREAVGASQRAYTGFLNKLRADTFDNMIKQAKALGHDISTTVGQGDKAMIIPTKETKAIAKFINNATGRGDLGSLNKMTNELNLLLWSPRMISSRINMLANPKIYTDLPKGMRLEGLKSLLGIAALGTAIDTLAAYGGAKVSNNILSTDYGKSRFGTKLIDPWGGLQQYIVAAARMLAGKTDSKLPTSRLDIAGRFLANKESPAANLAHQILTAKKFTGGGEFTDQYNNKTSIQSEIGKRFTPIFIQDLEDLSNSEPDWSENIGLNSVLGIASLAGMSQNYPEKKDSMKFRNMKLKL